MRHFTALIFLILFTVVAHATDVSLAWDASITPTVTGYKVYYGNSSGTYGTPIVIGNQTTYTVPNLSSGTFYFAVTAFDAVGNESDFSNEVSQIISGTLQGDLNSDGVVNVLDLQIMINAILGTPFNGTDLNGDGNTNVLDLQLLTNIILGV